MHTTEGRGNGVEFVLAPCSRQSKTSAGDPAVFSRGIRLRNRRAAHTIWARAGSRGLWRVGARERSHSPFCSCSTPRPLERGCGVVWCGVVWCGVVRVGTRGMWCAGGAQGLRAGGGGVNQSSSCGELSTSRVRLLYRLDQHLYIPAYPRCPSSRHSSLAVVQNGLRPTQSAHRHLA